MSDPIGVFYEDRIVGGITITPEGPSFTYDESWTVSEDSFPISLAMPTEGGSVSPSHLVLWLANLLPEADNLIAVGRNLGISPNDVIGLLENLGRDTAGALSFGQGREPQDKLRAIPNDEALSRII